jgi:putative ABC transport system substrate-binding protein
MHRRSFIALLGGAIALPCVAAAREKPMPAIGYLNGGAPGPNAGSLAAFRQGLSEGGYIEGQNVVIEYRWAEGSYDRLPAMAADLVGRQVDVIAASNLPSAQAAKRATSIIPIIFLSGGDPVERGLVASLARPGGNLTGISILVGELMPKRLDCSPSWFPRPVLSPCS